MFESLKKIIRTGEKMKEAKRKEWKIFLKVKFSESAPETKIFELVYAENLVKAFEAAKRKFLFGRNGASVIGFVGATNSKISFDGKR